MTVQHFGERLMGIIKTRRSHVVVGLDPDYELIPGAIRDAFPVADYENEAHMMVACYRAFLHGILDAVADDAAAVKIQLAYFEALGAPGYQLYEDLIEPARERGLLVIADAKRGDIGSTAEAYAKAHLDRAGADALTVNPYLGTDSVEPFLRRVEEDGKGLFILVKTSNASSVDIQDLELVSGERVYTKVAELVNEWARPTRTAGGYSSVGAVVGATHPNEGARLRGLMPGVPFLVPGYGAQGATADALRAFFDKEGLGTVVNSSRAILYAYRKHADSDWQDAARQEAREMKAALWRAAGLG